MRKSNRTMVKAYALEHGINFRTVSRAQKSPRRFYILRTVLEELRADETVIVSDIHCFAELRLCSSDGTLRIDFTWLQGGYDGLTGWEESVTPPNEALVDFMRESCQKGGPEQWKHLSLQSCFMTMKGYGSAWRTRQSGGNWPVRCGTISAVTAQSRSAFTTILCHTLSCSRKRGTAA